MELIRGVRPMTARDIEAVTGLEQVCFSEKWSEGLLRSGLDSRLDTYFVYEDHGQVLGYSIIRILADEGEIQRIAVLPVTAGRESQGNSWTPWSLFPEQGGCVPLPWRSARATPEPESFMNPMVSGRRPCEGGITVIRPRMQSSCGTGEYETIST